MNLRLRLILSEDLFFRDTMILGRKLTKLRLISSEDFFLENTIILRRKLAFVLESQIILLLYPESICMTSIGIPIAWPASEVMVVPTREEVPPK